MAIPNIIMEALITNAVKAASGDNVQPWNFVVDNKNDSISINLDSTRDLSPINAGQRMSRIACGAAMENLIRTAQRMGYEIEHEDCSDDALARIKLNIKGNLPQAIQDDLVLLQRCTNRRFYDRREVPRAVLRALRKTCVHRQEIKTHFLTDPKARMQCGKADARGTSLMYFQPSIRRTMSSNINFETPDDYENSFKGIPCASLEISALESLALRLMFKAPNWILRYGGSLKAMEWHFQKLHRSASGLCLITAPDNNERTDVFVGQAMQKAWLAMTEYGLAVQPMMSVFVLDGIRTLGEEKLRKEIGYEKVLALIDEIKVGFALTKVERPAFLFRFGYASPPGGRSGRRHLSEVLRRID